MNFNRGDRGKVDLDETELLNFLSKNGIKRWNGLCIFSYKKIQKVNISSFIRFDKDLGNSIN